MKLIRLGYWWWTVFLVAIYAWGGEPTAVFPFAAANIVISFMLTEGRRP